jgi:RNase P subunit RPR2
MTTEESSKSKQKAVVKEKQEETQELDEEEVLLEKQKQNIEKIKKLNEELDRINHKGGPDIRICPKCFSLKIRPLDTLKNMGIENSYPVYVCLDCGWRTKTWIYLDRQMSEEERENFYKRLLDEK